VARTGRHRPHPAPPGGPPAAPARSRRREFLWLLVIVGLAAALRIGFFFSIADTSMPARHAFMTSTDEHAFYQWAQTIIAGD